MTPTKYGRKWASSSLRQEERKKGGWISPAPSLRNGLYEKRVKQDTRTSAERSVFPETLAGDAGPCFSDHSRCQERGAVWWEVPTALSSAPSGREGHHPHHSLSNSLWSHKHRYWKVSLHLWWREKPAYPQPVLLLGCSIRSCLIWEVLKNSIFKN